MLEVATRLIFPLIMVLSAYFFFAGHNTPGGGFAGGLTAGLALVLRYLAGGRYELGETLPLDAGKVLGTGLALSAGTAVTSLLLGAPVLSSAVFEFDVPVLGHVKLVTALFFDLGVYLIVVGLVLDVLRSLGARVDVEMAEAGWGAAMTHLHRSARAHRRPHQRRGLPAAGAQSDANAVGTVAHRQCRQPADPDRSAARRAIRRSAAGRATAQTTTADPLAQGMILTAIVITMGIAAFVLALTYRSYRLTTRARRSPTTPRTPGYRSCPRGRARDLDEDPPQPDLSRDTDEPDELDALPGHQGSR